MNVTLVGAGYVGLVTGACLSEVGNHVCCIDSNEEKIAQLQSGEIPIYEPGLAKLVRSGLSMNRLTFRTDIAYGVSFADVIVIAVGTPQDTDGSADLSYVLEVAQSIGDHINSFKVVANKSTVPVGTADLVMKEISAGIARRNIGCDFSVVSNPEFLKEGSAIDDFQKPDRIIVGVEDADAAAIMRELYTPFNRSHDRMIFMDVRSAELTKYASNAMLATKISFMNEVANLAERIDADIEQVRIGMGADPRIGYQFIYPGCGYGGSCFPKDIGAMMETGASVDYQLMILGAVSQVNDRQKHVLVDKVEKEYGSNLSSKHFAIWGLAFKPNTDDIREAPSLTVIEGLLDRGATISAFDPGANSAARQLYENEARVNIVDDAYDAIFDADGLLLLTEWKIFRSPDFALIKSRMRSAIIFDGRNVYDPHVMEAHGFTWHGIGRARAAITAPVYR